MHRNSNTASHLVALAAGAGVTITGRQLQSWSAVRLMPPPDADEQHTVAHLAALASVYRSGPGAADRASLILLARGFPCERVRDAITRRLGASSASELATYVAGLPASLGLPDPFTDGGSTELANVSAILGTVADGAIGPDFGAVVGSFRGAIEEHNDARPFTDQVAGTTDTPDQVQYAAISDLFSIAVGQNPTAGVLPPSIVGGDTGPEDDGILDPIGRLPVAVQRVMGSLSTISLGTLAAGAATARRIIGPLAFPGLDGEALDERCAMLAPVGILLGALAASLPDEGHALPDAS